MVVPGISIAAGKRERVVAGFSTLRTADVIDEVTAGIHFQRWRYR